MWEQTQWTLGTQACKSSGQDRGQRCAGKAERRLLTETLLWAPVGRFSAVSGKSGKELSGGQLRASDVK